MHAKKSLSPKATFWALSGLGGLALCYSAILAKAGLEGAWILDPQGNIIPTDFFSFWSTSLQLRAGPAAAVYDWDLHHAGQVALLGPDHRTYLPWLNPPSFLFAVIPLAFLPYPTAFLSWVLGTLAVYVAAVRTIVPNAWAMVGACAFPATLWTAAVGQNGFLTAALVGGALGLIERRPVLAGILLGFLTYKPHFGILFPVALVAGARWRVIATAGVTTLLLVALTAGHFGADVWTAFVESLSRAERAVLAEGRIEPFKNQSFYGAVLWLGGSAAVAWVVQALAAAAAAAAAAWTWRGGASLEVRAAAVAVGSLIATPYVFIYDFPVLAVAIAFLIRGALLRGFLAGEIALVALASSLVLVFPSIRAPAGLLATVLVALAVAWRAAGEHQAALSTLRPYTTRCPTNP